MARARGGTACNADDSLACLGAIFTAVWGRDAMATGVLPVGYTRWLWLPRHGEPLPSLRLKAPAREEKKRLMVQHELPSTGFCAHELLAGGLVMYGRLIARVVSEDLTAPR
jgi:hypothetical protein